MKLLIHFHDVSTGLKPSIQFISRDIAPILVFIPCDFYLYPRWLNTGLCGNVDLRASKINCVDVWIFSYLKLFSCNCILIAVGCSALFSLTICFFLFFNVWCVLCRFEKQDGVVLIATTRNLKQIDQALKRPGRMDRILHLQRPTQMEREKILRIAAKETMDDELIGFVDWRKVTMPSSSEVMCMFLLQLC